MVAKVRDGCSRGWKLLRIVKDALECGVKRRGNVASFPSNVFTTYTMTEMNGYHYKNSGKRFNI